MIMPGLNINLLIQVFKRSSTPHLFAAVVLLFLNLARLLPTDPFRIIKRCLSYVVFTLALNMHMFRINMLKRNTFPPIVQVLSVLFLRILACLSLLQSFGNMLIALFTLSDCPCHVYVPGSII